MVGARGLQSDDKRFKEERPVLVAGCVPVNTPKPMPSYTLSCVNCVVCGLHLKKKRREGGRKRPLLGMCPIEAPAHGIACVPNYSFLQYAVYIPQG